MLPRQFRLACNADTGKWELIRDEDGAVLKTYRTMKMALSRREIERAIDNDGLVTVYRRNGNMEILQYPTRSRR